MGYPTINKFDVKFIERTNEILTTYDGNNDFTLLINSLLGLIFIPHEFQNKGHNFKVKFLKKSISEYEKLTDIFSGVVQLTNEVGGVFEQKKFYYKPKDIEQTIHTTTIGCLLKLFRNAIAHQNIIPVAEGENWHGIVVKNYKNSAEKKKNNFNFEAFLTQKDVQVLSTLISDEYLLNN
jgi:hypothetical protein